MSTKIFRVEEFAGLEKYFRRNLMNCLSGYKSLNLVGTINAQGQSNLAPFSQVFHLGATPALMGMIIRPDTVPRHTLQNIEDTGYYTLNHVHSEFYTEAHQTAARYEGSEFEAVGLETTFSEHIPAPYVKKSPLKIGLKLEEKHPLAINGTIMIIGSVQEIRIQADCVGEDGFIDLEKLGTVTCAGLDTYYLGQKIGRLTYPKPDKKPSLL